MALAAGAINRSRAWSRPGSKFFRNNAWNVGFLANHVCCPVTAQTAPLAATNYRKSGFVRWLQAEVPKCADLRPVLALKPTSAGRRLGAS
jgi:hypothetical protein